MIIEHTVSVGATIDVQGYQVDDQCIDPEICIIQEANDNYGDIYYSYSIDGGASWSESVNESLYPTGVEHCLTLNQGTNEIYGRVINSICDEVFVATVIIASDTQEPEIECWESLNLEECG